MNLLDKLINNIKFDKKYVLFSIIIVISGIITGSLFIVILNNTDKNIIIEYISSFIKNINTMNILKNTFITNYICIFILIIIGYSCFLFPINILILFYKAFIIGFTISSFILTYKTNGILLAIVYIIPHLIINILIFALITAFTLRLSLNMTKCIIKRKNVNIRGYFNKYLSLILLSLLIITLTSLYESYLMPYLLNLVIKIL